MRIAFLGTFDLSKPRTRMLRESLRQIDPDLKEIGFDVWRGVGDKSLVTGIGARARILFRMIAAYPVLIARYLFAGRHDVVVIGYMGLFDVLVLAPLAKLRGKPVVWDAFLSIYDTYARDRGLARESSIVAKALRVMERMAARLADYVVLDTKAHAAMMGRIHQIPSQKLASVLVGAEAGSFASGDRALAGPAGDRVKVLFYGQFIPLHGIGTIVDAALDPRGMAFDWIIVGTGQEAASIDRRLDEAGADHITRITWIEYEELQRAIGDADITLGIFGTSEKAASVIPNKVYQALLCAKPIVTQESGAMRELAGEGSAGLYLVPPGDPAGLLDALERFAAERGSLPGDLYTDLIPRFAASKRTEDWRAILEQATGRPASETQEGAQ